MTEWEQQVLAFARDKGEPWSIYAAMGNWRTRALKAESLASAKPAEACTNGWPSYEAWCNATGHIDGSNEA